MQKEMEERDEEQAEAFKGTLFAHSMVNQNPELFQKLYPDVFGLSEEEEYLLEFERPETPADLQRLMNELQETGWSGR
jgi:hypothetical protein